MKDAASKPKIAYIRALPRAETRFLNRIRNRLDRHYAYQDGFFRASLHAAFDVEELFLERAQKNPAALNRFDALFVNWKSPKNAVAGGYEDFAFLKAVTRPKILVATNAEPHHLPGDDVLDLFDIVFKREMFRDRDRYGISSANREKLHTTMLSCPLVKAPVGGDMAAFDATKFGFRTPSQSFDHDVFFAGGCTSQHRFETAAALHRETAMKSFLSLYSTAQGDVGGQPFEGKRLGMKQYLKKTRRSKINLALDGIGPFTYRHLELWCLCAFFIGTPAINDLDLPILAQDGKHFISYSSIPDLIDKCRHYREKDAERNTIARAGRALFEEYYDFKKHGAYIKSLLT